MTEAVTTERLCSHGIPVDSPSACPSCHAKHAEISILHITKEYRGDHDAEVKIAIRPISDETVAQLIQRLKLNKVDLIEIRVVS